MGIVLLVWNFQVSTVDQLLEIPNYFGELSVWYFLCHTLMQSSRDLKEYNMEIEIREHVLEFIISGLKGP